MSSRTVAVVLKAQVDDYVSQMSKAQQHTTDVEKAARSATEQFRLHNEALTKVGVGMAAVGAAAAVGLGIAVKAATEYGGKMAQLQSLSHASVADMNRLSDAAMKQGQAYGYSATQVADAEIELTKAGRSASQILGGDLKGSLALAAAGQLDVAKATQIAVSAVTQFASSGATIPQVADALAAGADKALGSVEDLGQGLAQGGLVASQMGLTLDDTVGTLSLFAQNALMGSDAGTSLKNMFLVLQSPTQQAQKYLDKYNITAYDTQGKFVGITKLAGELQTAFKGKSDAERDAALSTIFGSDAIRSANILYKEGAAGVKGWIDAVDDSGFASAQAAGKLNSLEGDVKKLSAAFQTDLIKAGSAGNGAFRGTVQEVTSLVEAIGDVPQPIMAAGVAVVGLVAGVGLLGGGLLVAIPKIAATKTALTELGISGRQAAGVFGKGSALLVGITAIAGGFAALATHGTASAQQITEAGQSAEKGWKGVSALFKGDGGFLMGGGIMNALKGERVDAGAAKVLDSWTFGISHFSDVYKTNEGQFDALGQQLAGLAQQDYGKASSSFASLVSKYKLGASDTKALLDLMPAYRDELVKQAEAAHVSASDHNVLLIAQRKGAVSAKVLASAQEAAAASAAKQQEGIDGLAGSASDATVDVKKLSDAIAGFGSVTLDARSAQRDFEKAVDDAREAAKKAGDATKDTTQADRDKQASLDSVASSAIAVAAAFSKQPGGIHKAEDALANGRKQFIGVAKDMGIGRAAAEKLADSLGLIPSNVKTAVGLTGGDTLLSKINRIRDAMNNLQGLTADVYIQGRITGLTDAQASQVARNAKFAAGGPVNGSGPKGVDSVYAVLAPGEHVLTAPEVDRMGGQAAVSAFRSDLMTEVQAYAKGGAVKKRGAGNAIDRQKALAADAEDRADAYQKSVIAQKKKAAAAQKAADKAQKAYENIDGTKKNAAAKKAAKAASAKAAKAATAASQKVDDLRTKRDDARSAATDATASAQDLRNDREDFVSTQRRATADNPIDPLSYIDQLRSMSRDDNYSAADRKKYDDAANQYEKSLVSLSTKADAASKNLDALKSSSQQMHDSIQQSISSGFGLGSAAQQQTQGNWVQQGGIRFQTTSGGPSASSIAGYYTQGATTAKAFAGALQQLAGRGLNTALLAELAGMGTEQGLPIAQAILAGSDGDLQTINSGYTAIGQAADVAGTTVANANYSQQIADADAKLAAINTQLADDGEKLRHLIASAFGLPGYATGTSSASRGIRWVGEHGPELAGFGGGEKVLTAEQSRRWVTGGGMAAPAPQPITVQASPVTFPSTLLLQDAHGFEARFRVVAQQEIQADAAHDAVLMMGAPAV